MIKVSIFYPNSQDTRFDLEYYCDTHIPLMVERLGATLKGVEVDYGINGGAPDSKPPFHAACHLLFDTLSDFYEEFAPHAAELQGDIPNYTDSQTLIQISEIKIP